jgi:phospholipase A1/A2
MPLAANEEAKDLSKKEEDTSRTRPDLFEDSLFGHEPVYFILGSNPIHSKFQLSFKYRFLNLGETSTHRWDKLENLYFGYTQTSYWDLESSSAPFVDSSYKPELFFYCSDIPQAWIPGITRLGLQTGFHHESNGRDGEASREVNIFYIKPMFTFGDLNDYHFIFFPKIWVHLGNPSENIEDYRGFFDLGLSYGIRDGFLVSSNLRKGVSAGRGSIQMDCSYPMNKMFTGKLNFYLQAQLYSGYGETLLYYDQRYTFFRIGFAVYR